MNSTHSRTIVKQFYALLLSFSLALTPVAAADAERVFAQVSPSIVVIAGEKPDGDLEDIGSGVVVGEGIVITNCHVVEDVAVIVIKQARDAQGAKNYAIYADVTAVDNDNDLCLLYAEDLTEPPAAPAIKLGAAKDLDIGEKVYAVGAPDGLDLSLSRGIVTQLRGIGIKGRAPIVQTDATTWGGSSGGGLFNEKGELVGIVTFGPGGTDSIGFAMPVEMVSDLMESVHLAEEKRKAQSMCAESPQYQCVLKLAQQAAKQIDNDNHRHNALVDVAIMQARAGYFNDAKTTAQQIPTNKNIEDYDYTDEYIDQYSTDYASLLLHEVAIKQAEEGKFKEAKATALQIDDAEDLAKALRDIAIAQAQAGNFDDAKATAEQISDPEDLARILNEIAIAHAQAGDFGNAKVVAKQINDAYYRAIALDNIAFDQIRAGYSDEAKVIIDDALHSARQIDDALLRAGALGEIAVTQGEVGNSKGAKMIFDEALRSADQIGNVYPYDEALKNIAIAQARAEYFDDAMKTVRWIDYIHIRDEALRGIAIAQAKADFFNSAKETIEYIQDVVFYDEVLIGIVGIQAESGDFSGAVKTAQLIRDDVEKAQVLANIAAAMAEQ